MSKSKKWLGTALSAALTVSLVAPGVSQAASAEATASATSAQNAPAAASGTGARDIAGHWAEKSLRKWESYGLVHGYADHTFRPDAEITRAEFVSIVNHLFGFSAQSATAFNDVPATAWYANALSIARQAGYFKGLPGNLAKPTDKISRQDAVVLLAQALELSQPEDAGALTFKDKEQIRAYALASVQALSGAISGYSDGTFRPDGPISRAEAVSLIDKLVPAFYAEKGTFSGGTIAGHAIVAGSGVVLSDAVIEGNLYLAPGIGDGEATLNNVTVKGVTFVSGGGGQPIILNGSKLGEVRVNRQDGGVRLSARGATEIRSLIADSPSKIELGEGAKVENAKLNRAAEFDVAAGASIASLAIGGEASGTKLTGQGDIAQAAIQAAGVTLNGAAVEAGTVAVARGAIVPATAGESAGGAAGGGSGGSGGGSGGGQTNAGNLVNLVDKDATDRTKSLFVYLNESRGKSILFGQQHATTEGLSFTESDGTHSDSLDSVGDYPGLFGWDTLSLEGFEKPGVRGDFAKSRDNLIDVMKKAYKSGGVLTLSAHMPNFVTGNDFYDTKGNVVSHILPGGDKHEAFNAFLDNIADFANNLKDDAGKPIPVIFRPFHEQNGSWFWWGAAFTTTDEYKEIYRYTVEYLRDKKGVRNFLYAYSPGGGFGESEETYLKTYPGDDYVDILGFDSYYNGEGDSWFESVKTEAKTVSKIADRKKKVAALTEFGYQKMKVSGNATKDFFTRLAGALKSDPDSKKMAYMLTWANFNGVKDSAYVPYHTGDPEREHEMLPDFRKFYEDSYSTFSRDVKGAYDKKVRSSSEQGFMHVVSPTDQGTIKDATTKIRVRVLNENDNAIRVAYKIGESGAEQPLVKDPATGYYTADWSPEAELNGKTAELTVTVYRGSGNRVLYRQTNTVFVKVSEVQIGAYTFDDGIDGVQYNGEYSGSLGSTNNGGISRSDFNGGSLRIDATKLNGADTWQEFKLELKNAKEKAGSDKLTGVKRVKMDVWVPASLGAADNASIRGVAQLPPDWETKYGMDTTYASLASLPKVTVGGIEYVKFSPTFDLTDDAAREAADDIALSVVGGGWATAEGETVPIYADNIRLFNTYSEATSDPAFVDDFESYLGSDEALAAKFVHAGGDPATAALDGTHKHAGGYGLKYAYTLGNNGYAGITKALNGVDWSGYNALQFWYEPDGQGQKLVMQVNVGGKTYEYYPDTATKEAAFVTAPFNEFVPANGATGTLTKTNLKNVQAFSIYTNARPDGNKLTSSMYFDDIRAVNDPDAGTVPGGSEGGGLPVGTLFDFEKGIAGWTLNDNTLGATNLANSDDGGTKTLSADFPSAPASEDKHFELAYMAPQDLSNGSALTLKARVSEGTAQATLFVKHGNWTWVAADPIELTTDYKTISLDLNAGSIDKTNVVAVGLQISSPTGEGTKTVYVDDVTLAGAGGGSGGTGGGEAPGTLFSFDDSVQNWSFTANELGASNLSNPKDADNGVLAVDFPTEDNGKSFELAFQGDRNLSQGKLLKLRARVTSGTAKAKLFIKTGAGWTWADSGETALTSDYQWISLDLDDAAKGIDKSLVKAIGVQVYSPGGEGTRSLYVDDVTLE